MRNSKEFYNHFDKKLIQDYLTGNKRIETAITNLSAFIPQNIMKILDLGCGLGWSSHEYACHFENAEIKGIDLSPVLIKNANEIFSRKNLSFEVLDITDSTPPGKYDAVVMIDVYEHIPRTERKNFHQSLKNILADQGRLLLACPSKYHQNFLKDNNPGGLQPIDEDVDYMDIATIANDIGGEVIYFEYQKIWQNYDYFYVVIEVNPIYGSNYKIKETESLRLEPLDSRKKRLEEKLGLDFSKEKEQKSKSFTDFFSKFYRKIKTL